MTVKVKEHRDIDKMLRALDTEYRLRVGIMGSEALQAKRHRDGQEGEGLTVVEVAQQHEFGVGVPQRSFLRAYHDENAVDIKARMKKAAKAILEGRDGARQLGLIGLRLVDGINDRIEAGIPPENSQATIDRKGSETPLIDTGQLKSSITDDVRINGRVVRGGR